MNIQSSIPADTEHNMPLNPVATPIQIEIRSSTVLVEDRYTRIRQLGWDIDLLRRIHVMVVGAGALGNEVLKNLALLGVGNILVVDMDKIEDTNLARSVLFRTSDIGRYKAEVAAERVRDLNADINIHFATELVQEAFGLGVFRRMDIVFGCLDNRQARLDVSRACWQTLTPYIDGGLHEINGDVRFFLPPITACYGCTLSNEARHHATDRHSCLKVKMETIQPTIPTAPTISSMIAAWQVQMAVKYLHDMRVPTGERVALYGLVDELDRYPMSFNTQCTDHDITKVIEEPTVMELPCHVSNTTLAELVARAQSVADLGNDGEIAFDFDIVLTGVCHACNIETAFHRRLTSLHLTDITCEQCGNLLDLTTEYQFTGKESYAHLMLEQLGVPPLHIVTGKDWGRGRYIPVEISNDLDSFFGDNAPHNPKLIPVSIIGDNWKQYTYWIPKHITVNDLLLWQASNLGLRTLATHQHYTLSNDSQGYSYELTDTLNRRTTQPGDTLRVEIITTTPIAPSVIEIMV